MEKLKGLREAESASSLLFNVLKTYKLYKENPLLFKYSYCCDVCYSVRPLPSRNSDTGPTRPFDGGSICLSCLEEESSLSSSTAN